MAITINPNRINISGASISGSQAGRAGQREAPARESTAYTAPKRVQVNSIPEPELLEARIQTAVSARHQGMVWDRGTLLNILV